MPDPAHHPPRLIAPTTRTADRGRSARTRVSRTGRDYLRHPDGNGVEQYRDRPEGERPRNPDGSPPVITP